MKISNAQRNYFYWTDGSKEKAAEMITVRERSGEAGARATAGKIDLRRAE